MAILITGGNGFIGKNLVAYFRGRYLVLAPARAELDLLDDQAVRKFFQANDIDIVIHSATTPGHRNAPPVEDLVARNLRIFWNLARNRNRFRKMIYLGSGAVYDMRHYAPKMPETYFDTHVPADAHGFSKYLIARYIEALDNIIELRLFGVFGKHEDYEIRFISNAICKAIFDLPITLRQNRRFDYLYVEDLGPIVEAFFNRDTRHRFYNVTPDTAAELHALAETVREVAGKAIDIQVAEAGMGLEYSGDNSRMRAEFPDVAFTAPRRAIEALHAWYLGNRNQINKQSLMVDK